MNDPRKQERRRRMLMQRAAAERIELDRDEADWIAADALERYRRGEMEGAERVARKALALFAECLPAIGVLAQVCSETGRTAEAAHYYELLSRLDRNPSARPYPLFNYGLCSMQLGRLAEAKAAFTEVVEKTALSRDSALRQLRDRAGVVLSAIEVRVRSEAKAAPAKPARPESRPPEPPPESPPPPQPKADLPRISVEFVSGSAAAGGAGTLTDFLLLHRFLALKHEQGFADLLCLGSLTGVDSYHYQQETARKVLRHFKGRALLADETGLGKTIEACLVLKEYWVRGMVRRALVLAPPSLVPQWKGELAEKFSLTAASPDGAEFRADPAKFWREQPLVIASIAQARLEPHAGAVASAAWDMVIVDEAHCLKNRSSANWKLVDSLTKKFILMLTATPVENSLTDLYSLITVLKPGLLATEADFKKTFVMPGKPKSPKNPEKLRELVSEVMIRNTRSAVDVRLPHRMAASVVVQPSPPEAQAYERVSAFVAQRYRPREAAQAALLLQTLQRQAGSSPHALSRALANALGGESWLDSRDRAELEAILELATAAGETAKGAQLIHLLEARSGKVVVFTEFLPTLGYLAELCHRHGIPYSVFSGDLSRAEKEAAIARFRDDADVLLSTGAGGEGRNLQFANTVVNFDLAWNPMRLEQRIGRVHRIGQTREVFVFNLCQAGSIEEQILRVLHDKINMFELVVGEIDAILGELDDSQDFAGLILDLWVSGQREKRVGEVFDELADRLGQAKQQYARTKALDENLFQRDFEV